MSDRIAQELALLREFYPALEYREAGHWVRIPQYTLPPSGEWTQVDVTIAFQLPGELPAVQPYAFWVMPVLTLQNSGQILNAVVSA